MALVYKNLSDIVTLSRASARTVTSSAGLLTALASGAFAIDYNPSTLAVRGMPVEEQRTNLFLYSQQLDNAAWTKGSACTITANAAVAPDGTTTADKVESTGAVVSDNRVQQIPTVAVVNGTVITFSVWLKADAPTTSVLRVANQSDGDGANLTVNVTTAWQRFEITRTFTGASAAARGCINSQTVAGTVYAWGAQFEVGSYASSYMGETTSAAITRLQDSLSISPISPWHNAVSGTFYVEFESRAAMVANTAILSANDATLDNYMAIGSRNASAEYGASMRVAAGSPASIGSFGATGTTVQKAAFAYQAGAQANSFAGGSEAAGTEPAIPAVTQITFGTGTSAAASTVSTNFWLRKVIYYPAVKNTQTLTA